MNETIQEIIISSTKAKSISEIEEVQSLWSGYGMISRVFLEDGKYPSVIVKHVSFPNQNIHPRGWNSNISHERKVKSYEVETNWYTQYASKAGKNCKVPEVIEVQQLGDDVLMVMEDLDASGFSKRISNVNRDHLEACLKWLAYFHATYLGVEPKGIWDVGTYWHLETRPDELEVLGDVFLKNAAGQIDFKLSSARYRTLVHGDAKLANFCFSENGKSVAGVDFQYVGGGCGMKDLAYFLGSCLSEEECENNEGKLLDTYFKFLKEAIKGLKPLVDFSELEKEWRGLFHWAWADFHRFLKGWSPGHWKINSYSERITQKVLAETKGELSYDDLEKLLKLAVTTAREAGGLIQSYAGKVKAAFKEAGSSEASQVFTEADEASQKLILEKLERSIIEYKFGLLTEESEDDQTRLSQKYFWCIDPLDGTLPFSQGISGYSVSIALVSKSGQSILGVVFDPVSKDLYHAITGKGSFKNGNPIPKPVKNNLELIVDQSFFNSPEKNEVESWFAEIDTEFETEYIGGAVLNAIHTAKYENAVYLKMPKKKEGGGSIWDFAASSLIIEEMGGMATTAFGKAIPLNNPQSTFMNEFGIIMTTSQDMYERLFKKLERFL